MEKKIDHIFKKKQKKAFLHPEILNVKIADDWTSQISE